MKPDIVCPHCGNKLRKVPLSNFKAECDACEALFEYGKMGRGPVLYPYIDPKLCRNCGKELTGRQEKWCCDKCRIEFERLCGWHVRWDGYQQNLAKNGKPTCERCGKVTSNFEVDHKTPVALGGTHDPENLQLLCRDCHVKKTTSQIRLIKAGLGQTTLAVYQTSSGAKSIRGGGS